MKKAALHNLGCKVNAYETEAMEELLKKDGFTIFGQNPEKSSNNDMFIPDFELNISSNNTNNNNFSYPYIFSIYYKIEDKNYYIRS